MRSDTRPKTKIFVLFVDWKKKKKWIINYFNIRAGIVSFGKSWFKNKDELKIKIKYTQIFQEFNSKKC